MVICALSVCVYIVLYVSDLLWRAPELLRGGIEAPVSKEGDVYSFAIILHEIIGRQGPYGLYEVNEDDASGQLTGARSGDDWRKFVG